MEQNDNKTQASPQEATTVGMFLKYTRQNQKKSIETVSKALCIRKIYIKAIEESDFNELPPVPYGIGFIRSYSDFLGLNSDRIVQCYKEEALPKKNDAQSKPIVKKHTTLTIPNYKQILVGVALVLGLYFIMLAIENKKPAVIQNEDILASVEVENTEPLATEPQSIEEPTEQISEETEPQTIEILEDNYVEETVAEPEPEVLKNKIVVKFNGESWFEVKDKEQVYISGIYKKGFEYELPDVPNLIFSVGRYFNVDVYINGKLTKVAGPKKQTNISIDEFLNH